MNKDVLIEFLIDDECSLRLGCEPDQKKRKIISETFSKLPRQSVLEAKEVAKLVVDELYPIGKG